MEKDVTAGRYISGEGILRQLDPRCKLYMILAYVILTLLSAHPAALGISTVVLIVAWGMSYLPAVGILKSARGVLLMLVISELFSLIWLPVDVVLLSFWRLSLIILMSVIFSKTTEPRDILDGLRTGFPIGEGAAMSLAIALDFLPRLGREMERLKVAAASRGALYDEGNVFARAKEMLPLLIPLFRSTLGSAGRLADAMDLRGYNAGVKRTRMEPLKYCRRDYIALLAVLGYAILILLTRIFL
ncbi:MAG: energy-coupling factor transporter transmembrane protein EcfT [Eubacterium sp.]|nr:energy-coupling factor transporter transmembrane protein EcfT [Eubacterium sp.]